MQGLSITHVQARHRIQRRGNYYLPGFNAADKGQVGEAASFTQSDGEMMRRDVLTTCLALLIIVSAPADNRPLRAEGQARSVLQPPSDTPVFRSAAEAIHVDVTVTDRNGNPITDMAAADFQVFEDGAAQEITTFANIQVPSDVTSAAIAGVESDVTTNTADTGRVYVIAIDSRLSAANGLRARHLLKQFIDRHFGPNDLGAIVVLGQSLRSAGQDFTRSKVRLQQALDRVSGAPEEPEPRPDDPQTEASWATHAAINQLGSLADLVEFTLNLPHGRKALLLVAQGLGQDVGAVLEGPSRAKKLKDFCVQTAISRAMSCEPSQYLHRTLVAAARANLIIYPMDPSGLTGGMRNFDFIELARATGGFAIDNTNNFDEHFARLASDQGNYYLLGFNSSYKGRVGRSVPISVRILRPGAVLNARTNYVSPFPEEKERFKPETSRRLASAVASPVATGGLPLQVTAAPFKGPDGNSTVALAVHVDARMISFTERNDRTVGKIDLWIKMTKEGTEFGEGKKYEVKFDMRPATRASIQQTGLRLLAPVAFEKGRYQLRVAAGNDDVAGGVPYDIEIPDFDAPFVMSGLLVGSLDSTAILTAQPSNTGRIPGGSVVTPTTTRTFSGQDVIRIYTELYDDKASADQVGGHAELRNTAGQVVLTRPLERVPGESGLLEGHRMQVSLPLTGVAPGSYALQVHGRSGEDRDRRATRSLIVRVK